MKSIKSFLLAFTVLTATINFAFSQTTTSNQSTENLKTATIKVTGVTCSMDLKTISTNVESVKGVSTCTVGKQGATTTFEVKYNPALVSEKDIFEAIENTSGCENPEDRPYKVKQ